MKTEIHPANYRLCVFKDMSSGDHFITKSCTETRDTIEVDGVEYPLVKMEISKFSHPYYTGKVKMIDSTGRVDKFRNRYSKFQK
jgi:large subunit ribosomal protein L31